MARFNKDGWALAVAWLQLILAVAALGLLIYTAVSLGVTDSPSQGFLRDSVWRMVCCGCVVLIFPYLAIPQVIRSLRRSEEK